MFKLIDVDTSKVYYCPSLGLFKFYKADSPGWLRSNVEVALSQKGTLIVSVLCIEHNYVEDFVVRRVGDSLVVDYPKIKLATKEQIESTLKYIKATRETLMSKVTALDKAALRLWAEL
jgi:hypothetical protein